MHEVIEVAAIIYHGSASARTYLLLFDGRVWDFARGHIEEGEAQVTAALRVAGEETGLAQLVLDPIFRYAYRYATN